jgi:hypothetical protein
MIGMPRFGIKTLLIVFTVVAIWLATFIRQGQDLQGAGNEIRNCMMLVVFLASGFAAIYNQGRRRAFWSGFFATMLLLSVEFIQPYKANVYSIASGWATHFQEIYRFDHRVRTILYCNIWPPIVLSLAALVGILAVYFYDQSHETTSHNGA